MEIYSPKSQTPDNFKKNTMKKNGIMVNRKSTLTGSTFEFELENKNQKVDIQKHNIANTMFDFLKMRFYNRMKVYFDYEDKMKEKITDAVK
jgi:hypothetical protein